MIELESREFPFSTEGALDPINQELEETFLQDPIDGRYFSFNNLPTTLRSGGIDLYASWLSTLHSSDAKGRERYAEIGILDFPEGLFYQPRPLVEHFGVAFALETTFPRPIAGKIDLHTHRGLSTLSTGDVDRVPARMKVKASIVANPHRNYLVLPTEETEEYVRGPEWNRSKQHAEARRQPSVSQLVTQILGRNPTISEMDSILALLRRDKDENEYRDTFYYLDYMATQHKLGVYVSNRDGLYVKLNGQVTAHIQENIALAVSERIPLTIGS